ncbi:hypothetical protein [Chondromyces apiculatus]|uniref:Lipoprotein n=1 Tax=Chondromyces apiculatus DSM 436 TaxID=1192034 RepID=A0A017T8M6_9BACT|nr:hypothetical protein [Chondromyces apiculatus]EYF04961.1 Hypothetical protein CAP_3772 [Chondromyces apiculatus DSM 436]
MGSFLARTCLLLGSALVTAITAGGCLVDNTCPSGSQTCVDDNAVGDGRVSLVCADALFSGVSVVRSLGTAAACRYTPDEGLLVRVGTDGCDNLSVLLRTFDGEGRYRGDGTEAGPVQVVATMAVPDTGCQDIYRIQSFPNAACPVAPDACTVQVTGDFSPTRSGSLAMEISCGQLIYNHNPDGCGVCTAEELTVNIDGCTVDE